MKPVLYLSHFFKQNRQEYYDRLQSVRDNGTWEDWLIFFLQGIVEVSRQATETARKILTLREEHRHTITENMGRAAGNGHRVLDYLFQHPIVSVSDVRKLIGVSNPAANNLVARLAEIEIIREYTGYARNRKFINQSYFNLFHESD